MATKKQPKYVIVTTAHRGVFAGELLFEDNDRVTLGQCRMVVYYSADAKGVVGMAQNGPGKGAKVTPPADQAVLRSVTAVFDCSPEARAKFEAGPWS